MQRAAATALTARAFMGLNALCSCLASFHRLSETSSHRHQTPMPTAPHPEYLPDEKERGLKVLVDPRFPDVMKEELAKRIDKQGPIDIRCVRP